MKHGGKASKHQIARDLKISLDYAGMICKELKRKGEVSFSDGFYVSTATKKQVNHDDELKKLVASTQRVRSRSKRVIAHKQTKKSRVEKQTAHPLSRILGISEALERTLVQAGYDTVESIADAPIRVLMDAAKLQLSTAAQLINQARGKGAFIDIVPIDEKELRVQEKSREIKKHEVYDGITRDTAEY